MTSTSSKKKFLLGIVAILFLSSMVSGYYYSDSDITADTGFEIPQYDSQQEILTELVAPFLFITILFQIGIQRALMFTLDEDPDSWLFPDPNYRDERKRIRKQSTFLALVIAGMMVPTSIFRSLNDVIAIVFGGALYIGLAAIFIIFLYVIYSIFAG